MKSKRVSILLVFAVFIGVVVGLVLSSNFDWTKKIIAANPETITLGAQEVDVDPSDVASAQSLSKAFAHVANAVKGTVVTIKSTQTVQQDVPEFWQHFFNVPNERVRQGLGSGVIVNSDGYIITNNHVVEDADELQVSIGKENYDAKIVGRDPQSDLAVIKVDAKGLKAIKLGNSDELEVGEWVLAIGNPFDEVLDQTVTAGIVSAKGRTGLASARDIPFQDFIQTDAAINPGNSGGALVNMHGELVGINSMIFSSSGGNVGIGFAIPINLAKNVMQQLIASGKVSRGYLGVTIESVDSDMAEALGLDAPAGALVNQVFAGSPAAKVGVEEGDVILQVNGKKINDSNELMNTVSGYAPGTSVQVVLWRDGKEKQVTIRLDERPSNESVASADPTEETTNALGIEVDNLTNENMQRFRMDYEGESGVLVVNVKSGSPADKENLRPGDLIVSVNRRGVENVREFNALIQDVKPNDVVLLRLKRGNSSYFAAIRVPKNAE